MLKTRRFGYDGKGQALIARARSGPRRSRASAAAGHPRGLRAFRARGVGDRGPRPAKAHRGLSTSARTSTRRHPAPHRVPARVSRRDRRRGQQHRGGRSRRARLCRRAGGRDVRRRATAGRQARSSTRSRPASTIPATGPSRLRTRSSSSISAAIAGWPLGSPRRHGRMRDAEPDRRRGRRLARAAAEPGARLHLYGKREPRPGRKMGHVTRLMPRMTAPPRQKRANSRYEPAAFGAWLRPSRV